jgi:hypothetical protein
MEGLQSLRIFSLSVSPTISRRALHELEPRRPQMTTSDPADVIKPEAGQPASFPGPGATTATTALTDPTAYDKAQKDDGQLGPIGQEALGAVPTAHRHERAPEAEPAASTETIPEQSPPSLPTRSELDRILPSSGPITLKDGTRVDIADLKTRQLLALMRILTRGVGPFLIDQLTNQKGASAEAQVGAILGALLLAIPEAENEAILFVQTIAQVPSPPAPDAPTSAEDIAAARAHLAAILENPEIEDTIDIIQAALEREKDDLAALGKRIMGLLETFTKKAPNAL